MNLSIMKRVRIPHKQRAFYRANTIMTLNQGFCHRSLCLQQRQCLTHSEVRNPKPFSIYYNLPNSKTLYVTFGIQGVYWQTGCRAKLQTAAFGILIISFTCFFRYFVNNFLLVFAKAIVFVHFASTSHTNHTGDQVFCT